MTTGRNDATRTPTAYYNDNEEYVCQWLRNLIAAGHLPGGKVDCQSIRWCKPDELKRYAQCHFFAGIGGWAYALRLAGWPDDRPVWTGSCPCQPFSICGKKLGFGDERNLFGLWYELIRECRPSVVFGEQVAGKHGLEWLGRVYASMGEIGYRCGAFNLCAAGYGSPHIRQRLFFVAHTPNADGRSGISESKTGTGEKNIRGRRPIVGCKGDDGPNQWWDADECVFSDGKRRRIEPFLEPLAYGIPNRMGRLRAYGNAIVPQVAAAFVRAYLDSEND